LGYTFCIQILGSSNATQYCFLRVLPMANQKVTFYIRIIHEDKRIQCEPV
jgi:hypothetical protein